METVITLAIETAVFIAGCMAGYYFGKEERKE